MSLLVIKENPSNKPNRTITEGKQPKLLAAWTTSALSASRAGRHLLRPCATCRKYDGRDAANNARS